MRWPRLTPGATIQDVSIHFLNALAEMLEDYQHQKHTLAHHAVDRRPGIVRVKNISASDIPWLGIIGLESVLFDHDDDNTAFKVEAVLTGDTPDEDDHLGKFGVCVEPIEAGTIGRAIISGAATCKINVGDADHGFAELKDSDNTQLQSCVHGPAEILYKESGTGAKWGVVRIGNGYPPATHIKCQVDGAVAADDLNITVNNVKIMLPPGATTYPGTGTTAPSTVPNTHSGALDDDTYIEAIWNDADSEWRVVAGDCTE